MKHHKSELKEHCRGKTVEQLKKMVDEKRKEIIKLEHEARGNSQNRMKYTQQTHIHLSETKKEVAYMLTLMSQRSIKGV